jgi:hypothetical protein
MEIELGLLEMRRRYRQFASERTCGAAAEVLEE